MEVKLFNTKSLNDPAWTYFIYRDGLCVHQPSKLWRHKVDATRAARNYVRTHG